jgi:hypothetical protein
MTKDEALDLALEALEKLTDTEQTYEALDLGDKAITAIKQARSAPVQEPVGALILGGVIDTSDGPEYEEWDVEWNTKAVEALQEKLVTSNSVTVMLYTTPPAAQRQWVGLTDEEIDELGHLVEATGYCSDNLGVEGTQDFARAIEAKLKEKNNG